MTIKDGAKAVGQVVREGVHAASGVANRTVQNSGCSLFDICKYVCAVFLPPLAVVMHKGLIDTDFWIDLILTLIIYLPGILYALYVLLCKSGGKGDIFGGAGISPAVYSGDHHAQHQGEGNFSPLSSHATGRSGPGNV